MFEPNEANEERGEVPRFAVIGNPVAHSLSPTIHARFAEQTGIALTYTTLQVAREGFAAAAAEFFRSGGAGLNVTLPFKEEAFGWVTQRDPHAVVAGAVNTIVPLASGTRGCNTDGVGLLKDLEDNQKVCLKGRRILLLGAGGAVRGVVGPLLGANPSVVQVANRTRSRAVELVARLEDPRLAAVDLDSLRGPFDVVVNGTSAGLVGALPRVPDAVFRDALVYDLVYGEAARAFLEAARRGGARVVSDGLGMLVEQAAEAFALWHGVRPDTRLVLAGLRAP